MSKKCIDNNSEKCKYDGYYEFCDICHKKQELPSGIRITRQEFCDIINSLVASKEETILINNCIAPLVDGIVCSKIGSNLRSGICLLLSNLMSDTAHYIDWWLWSRPSSVSYKDKEFDVTTPSLLYDYLIAKNSE